MEPSVLPVLLGADMNCYSVARAFHEAYGVKSHAFGRYAMGETKYSKIVRFTAVPEMEDDKVLLKVLSDFALAHAGETMILLGCTDGYAEMLIRNKEALRGKFILPYIDKCLQQTLVTKESFYEQCEKYGIPYPKTVMVYPGDSGDAYDDLPFAYPVIIKPSSSIDYWKHEFPGMKKVYEAASPGEAKEITKRIFDAGYPESIIVQDKIPGADAEMRVLTGYSDRSGKVKMMCLGHVMLEEHTPKALGNHAAILTEYNRPLMEKLRVFLDDIGYTGFSNFDIKYDTRDGEYKVFEINLRQGRSNYYVTGAGLNIARYIVEDHVEKKELGDPLFYEEESYWRSIPDPVVWEYTAGEELVQKAKNALADGQASTALGYSYDLRFNPLRWAYLKVHSHRYYKKYAQYCPKPGNR